MFYGGLERETAVQEVKSNGPTAASIGQFELLDEIRVVDLTVLPPVRGLFADGTRQEKAAIAFLHQFVEDATLPIERDGREHIEYVPTQIVTLSDHFKSGQRLSLQNRPMEGPKTYIVLLCRLPFRQEPPDFHVDPVKTSRLLSLTGL